MVLNSKDVTVGYLCPECGSQVLAVSGLFSLSAKMLNLKCQECGRSKLQIEFRNDDRILFKVPCVYCGETHSYTISRNSAFSKDIINLNCKVTGFACAYIGKLEKVTQAINDEQEELIRMMKEYQDSGNYQDNVPAYDSIEIIHKINGKDGKIQAEPGKELIDPKYYDEVAYALTELYEEGCFKCTCGQNKGDYSITYDGSSFMILCNKCKDFMYIPMRNSSQIANDLLYKDKLVLSKVYKSKKDK